MITADLQDCLTWTERLDIQRYSVVRHIRIFTA